MAVTFSGIEDLLKVFNRYQFINCKIYFMDEEEIGENVKSRLVKEYGHHAFDKMTYFYTLYINSSVNSGNLIDILIEEITNIIFINSPKDLNKKAQKVGIQNKLYEELQELALERNVREFYKEKPAQQ